MQLFVFRAEANKQTDVEMSEFTLSHKAQGLQICTIQGLWEIFSSGIKGTSSYAESHGDIYRVQY